MIHSRRPTLPAGVLVVALALGALAPAREGLSDEPPVFAIRDARIVPVSAAPIEKGTVVVRDGLIEAVGAEVSIPPDAWILDGKGLVVYPGLLDAGSDIGLPAAAAEPTPLAAGPPGRARRTAPPAAPPATPPVTSQPAATLEETSSMNTFVRAADILTDGGARAEAARRAGITTVLTVPNRGIFLGQSALVNLNGEKSTMVVRAPVAMHLWLASSGGFREYPSSLMGILAFVRQAFLDARRYQECWETYDRNLRALRRPETNRALEALLPVAQKKMPLVIPANTAPEILRAIRLAEENDVRPILSGGAEAWKVGSLLKEKAIPVLVSLNFPEKPRDENPDADESLRQLQRRADAPKNPGELQKAGVAFCFFSDGLASPRDFLRNAARAVKAGLPADAALRAMTLSAAEILGAPEQLGSIEKGKIANLVVADGDLFAATTRLRYIFVDGKKHDVAAEPPRPRGSAQ
jgi:imidazolonepropionase-like amidohydrolase